MTDDRPGEAPVGYVATDPDGLVLAANDLVLRWLGRERSEVVGRVRLSDLLAGGGRIYYETHLAPTLVMTGSTSAVALDLATLGGPMPVFVTAVLDRDEAGAPERIRFGVVDAAERRSYELELLAERQRAEASERHARLVAQTLQQVLVPAALPTIDGLDVAAAFRPAGDGAELGGDFYDVFELHDGSWYAVVGDVCGKGVEAAVVTALARNSMRAEAVRSPSLAEALSVLNRALIVHNVDRHCTAALLRLVADASGWRATVCCAGHPLPLLRHRDGGVAVVGRPGPLLGIFPEIVLHEVELELRPGDELVLYTDGIIEGRVAGELFGEERLVALVAAEAPSAQARADAILHEVIDFQSGDTADDAAVLVVRFP